MVDEDIYPNLVNCLRTGEYTNEDFHTKISQEYCISREIAKMAAVRCCFNCKKTDILYDLLSVDNLNSSEIERMKESGLFIIDNKSIKIANGHNITEIHEFFSDNKDDGFFNYCNNFLTSWDVCSIVYKNNYPPSLLAEYSSIIGMNALRKEYYYKVWAERLSPKVLASIENNISFQRNKTSLRKIANALSKNAIKNEVRDFLIKNNYNIELASKKFNWDINNKMYWGRLIEEGIIRDGNGFSNIDMVIGYPIVNGIPVILKPYNQKSYFTCIDIVSLIGTQPSKDFASLVKRVFRTQKRAIVQYENNRLNKVVIDIMNEELVECYDKMLYLYISGSNSIVDYKTNWKEQYKDKIKYNAGSLESMWIFKDIISTMTFSKNIGICLYDVKGWTDILISNDTSISILKIF